METRWQFCFHLFPFGITLVSISERQVPHVASFRSPDPSTLPVLLAHNQTVGKLTAHVLASEERSPWKRE